MWALRLLLRLPCWQPASSSLPLWPSSSGNVSQHKPFLLEVALGIALPIKLTNMSVLGSSLPPAQEDPFYCGENSVLLRLDCRKRRTQLPGLFKRKDGHEETRRTYQDGSQWDQETNALISQRSLNSPKQGWLSGAAEPSGDIGFGLLAIQRALCTCINYFFFVIIRTK